MVSSQGETIPFCGLKRSVTVDEAAQEAPPIGRLGHAEEIARAALWPCGPAAGFVLGVVLPVHGSCVAR